MTPETKIALDNALAQIAAKFPISDEQAIKNELQRRYVVEVDCGDMDAATKTMEQMLGWN